MLGFFAVFSSYLLRQWLLFLLQAFPRGLLPWLFVLYHSISVKGSYIVQTIQCPLFKRCACGCACVAVFAGVDCATAQAVNRFAVPFTAIAPKAAEMRVATAILLSFFPSKQGGGAGGFIGGKTNPCGRAYKRFAVASEAGHCFLRRERLQSSGPAVRVNLHKPLSCGGFLQYPSGG